MVDCDIKNENNDVITYHQRLDERKQTEENVLVGMGAKIDWIG